MMRSYNLGWKKDSERHSLARRGVKTGRKSRADKLFDGIVSVPEKVQEALQPSKRRKHKKVSGLYAATIVEGELADPFSLPDEEECEEVLGVQ
jgi:hypothetical protein